MTEYTTEKCRVCLTVNKYDNISDCSSYAKFFTRFLTMKKSIENLALCMWCKQALKKAVVFATLALESEKVLQNEVTPDLSSTKRVYNLECSKASSLDIPPNIQNEQEEIDCNIIKTEEFQDSIHEEDNEIEIPPKMCKKKNKIKSNTDSLDQNNVDAVIEVQKKNKRNLDASQLNFEVEFLNTEEQIKEVELKRLKFKEFAFQCSDCGLGFVTSSVFEDHKIKHSELSGSHRCTICSLHFKSPEVLSQHLLAHRRRFKCVLCGITFNRWQHCVQHRYKCGGVVEPVPCDNCDKIFDNKYLLKMHMKVHKREKKYSCEHCGRKFVSKTSLEVHIRSHSSEKPYKCKLCSRGFTTSSNLNAHLSVHNNESTHYCVECHIYYKTAKSLKRHFRESARHITENKDMYLCKECRKRFQSEKLLQQHITSRHTREHRCSLCKKIFSNNSNLNKHLKCVHTT